MSQSTKPEYDVIVIGAGVVGPCIATAMARQGRKVLIVEREWDEPNRIVGELMQPSGLKSLKQLGMIKAVNNIGAVETTGYNISYHGKNLTIPYPTKDILTTIDTTPVQDVIKKGDEDKMDVNDKSLVAKVWEEDERVRGAAFHHGKFLTNLRTICLNESNVTKLDANVTEILKEGAKAIGIQATLNNDEKTKKKIYSKLVVCCDGIYSKFRKELSSEHVPKIGSYFAGLDLIDAKLPAPNHGHVILGKHAPVLMYQISTHHTRILCAIRSEKLPSKATVIEYLKNTVSKSLPKETQPAFEKALNNNNNTTDVYRAMPNQFLTAILNDVPGLVVVGDALNMRHPLTGGGMTVGLNDAVLVTKLLSPEKIPDLADDISILEQMIEFHTERKNLAAVVNVLSIALYSLFAADSKYLELLQQGCFAYFLKGGECVNGPVSLLSGLCPNFFTLFYHFFSVAFYSCYINFQNKGIVGFPLALFENICVFITAVCVFSPYMWSEMMS